MPSQASLRAAQKIAARSTGKVGTPIRSAFLLDETQTGRTTPLAGLLTGSGGRGGRTRLSLLLSLLWVNTAPPHNSTRAARWWAELIDLPEPATKGARTVSTNFHELQRRRFITLTPATDGTPPQVKLLNETGTGEFYQRPYLTNEHYIRIPETLWTTGKIGELDGRALAMFLILTYYQREPTTWTWFSSESFRRRHYLSDNLRTQGLNQLVSMGIAQMKEEYPDAARDGQYRTTRRRSYQLMPTYLPPKSKKPVPEQPKTSDSDVFTQLQLRSNARNDEPDPWSTSPIWETESGFQRRVRRRFNDS